MEIFVTLKQNDHITKPAAQNCSNLNLKYVSMYVQNTYYYFHDFRSLVKYATMQIEVEIKNGWSLKLCQMRQVDVFASASPNFNHLRNG